MEVVVANWLVEKVIGVGRYKDRVVKVNATIMDAVWEVVPCYYPQTGRSATEKEEFYELMNKVALT